METNKKSSDAKSWELARYIYAYIEHEINENQKQLSDIDDEMIFNALQAFKGGAR